MMQTRQGEKITWSVELESWVVDATGYSVSLPVGEYVEQPPLEDDMIWTGSEFIKEAH